ncbi:hypothetical protein [Nitrosomonas sp. Nm33]|uniref:hypothetical protein n=1 Tax=Nitrosomonas sp. Nm33 TaxID=133724 RepID=UPI000B8073EC|nr:hypothetical protein [Nitrosomonas sp. Nm33]
MENCQSDIKHWYYIDIRTSDRKLEPALVAEPMFNQPKQTWGMKEAWLQTRRTLHRRVLITIMLSYGLV